MSEDNLQNDWQKWFGQKTVDPDRARNFRPRRWVYYLGGLVLFVILAGVAKGIYADWLWFDSLGYGSVFSKIISARVALFFIAAAIAAVLFFTNLLLAARLTPRDGQSIWPWELVTRVAPWLKTIVILVVTALSLIFGAAAQSNWEIMLTFLNGQPFGVFDPLFGREVSFFVFNLPFWEFVRAWLIGVFVFSIIVSLLVYAASGVSQRPRANLTRPVLIHRGSRFSMRELSQSL